METVNLAVTTEWVNIKDKYNLVKSLPYMIDNSGGAPIYIVESLEEPTIQTGHLLSIGDNRIFVVNGYGVWVKTTGSTAIANLSAVNSTNVVAPSDNGIAILSDIDLLRSDSTGFTGSVFDLFNDLHSVIIDDSAINPKEILVHFKQTIICNSLGLGAYSGSFSNVEVQIGTSGGVFLTLFDGSADSTVRTSQEIPLPVTAGFNAIKVRFHTTNPISISNMPILKTESVVARLQARKPNDTITDINATAGGNLKMSLEEYESTFLTSPLPVRIIDSRSGREGEIDNITYAMITIDGEHHELHEGNQFYIKDFLSIASSGSTKLLFTTGATEPHLIVIFEGTTGLQVEVYEDSVASDNGSPLTPLNRYRASTNTTDCDAYVGAVITTPGTKIAGYSKGAARVSGGAIRASSELILKANTVYSIVLTNLSTSSANIVDFMADWYEHVD